MRDGMNWHKGNLATTVKNGARDLLLSKGGLLQSTPMTGRRGGPGRGFARSGWGVSLTALGKPPRAFYFRPSAGRPTLWPKFGDAQTRLNGAKPQVTLINNAPYIEEVPGASSLAQRAFNNAAVAIEKRNDRHVARYKQRLIRKGQMV
jgi:hypothetical protein